MDNHEEISNENETDHLCQIEKNIKLILKINNKKKRIFIPAYGESAGPRMFTCH